MPDFIMVTDNVNELENSLSKQLDVAEYDIDDVVDRIIECTLKADNGTWFYNFEGDKYVIRYFDDMDLFFIYPAIKTSQE